MTINKRKDEWINIGCSSNDKYAQHLGVMLYSLLTNCSDRKRVRIFIVDGGISDNSKAKLKKIVTKFGANIKYVKPIEGLVDGLKICRYLGVETYHRFSLIESLDVKRLLYLDCDLIVEGDVKELFDLDMGNNLLFAVEDILINNKKKKTLGIPEKEPYFNGGVLLINCPLWKKEKISYKIIDYIKENPENIDMADQDGSNAILHGKWKPLSLGWNLIVRSLYYKRFSFIFNKNYRDKLNRIPEKISIIHYAGHFKPWFYWRITPCRENYWKYLKQTPWKDYKYPDKSINGFFKEYSDILGVVIQKIIRGNLL